MINLRLSFGNRALKLFDLTLADTRHRLAAGRLREIVRAREVVADFLEGANCYGSTGPSLQKYFDAYAWAARLRPSERRS
jgi:hypothetical protein